MRTLLRRIWYGLRFRHRDDELTEEIEFHRAMTEQALEARGADLTEAKAAAQRALGNDLAARERARDVWIRPWLRDLLQDMRFAVRLPWQAPGFAATVIVVLGIGLGVNHLFLTLVYSSTMRGLPIARADRVLSVSTFDDRQMDRTLSYPEFDEIRTGVRAFTALGAYANSPVVIGDEGRAPDRLDGTYLSANAFDVIGVRPAFGRAFAAADDQPGAALSVMLGDGAWRTRYGGDPAVIGRSLLVNGKPATVIGIVPPKSGFPSTAEVWLPLTQMPGIDGQSRAAEPLRVIGRLRDDVTVSDGRAEIEAIVERASLAHPETNRNVRAHVVPINERLFGRPVGVWLAFISAAFVVVGVCAANVANLMLARGVQRTREMAIRASLGASRWRVVRQLLCEAAVLATLGGACGGALALAGMRLFEAAVPANLLPYWFDFTPDARVFAMLAGVSLLALLIFGVAPAFHASRTDVNLVLKASGRAAIGRRRADRWSSGFLTVQLGLATLLLALFVMTFRDDTPDVPSDATIASNSILTASITLPNDMFGTPTLRSSYYARLVRRVRAVPGVSSAALATALPRRGAVERSVEIVGERVGGTARSVWTTSIGDGYFDALGLSVLQGRAFQAGDGAGADLPAIVNVTFVEQLLVGGDAIGQRLTLSAPRGQTTVAPQSATIVGIAPDIRQRSSPRADPMIYLPIDAAPPANAVLLIRSPNEGAGATELREAALAADASVPPYRIMTMAAAIEELEWNGRTSARLVSVVSLASILLAAVGLYAVTAFTVSSRTQEIGLRMALGARARQIGAQIVGRASRQVGTGLMLGVLGVVAWDRLFGIGDPGRNRLADPFVLAVVAAILLAITILACLVPAIRAMRVDPLVALRHE